MRVLQLRWLRSLLPARPSVSHKERLRAGGGAVFGLVFTGLLSALAIDSTSSVAWLMAPMGASAVLLFALPSSPLAQPWSVLGGNLTSALVGVTCAKLIPTPLPAAGAAVFFAIGAMFALRCLHPPGGAIAALAVLGGPEIHAAGYGFALAPVALNSVLMLAAAVIYNNATGRRYPHTQQADAPHPHKTADVMPTARMGFTTDDLHAALKRYDQVLDISVDDLEALFRQTEQQAFRRRFGETRCIDIMSSDILSVDYATELAEAWQLMNTHAVRALPVVDRVRRVIGIVTRSSFLRHAQLHAAPQDDYGRFGANLRALLKRTPHTHSSKPEVVGQIMTAQVRTVQDTTSIAELVMLMADSGLHHVPVVNEERRLVGMVTQTDLVGALYETSLAGLVDRKITPGTEQQPAIAQP